MKTSAWIKANGTEEAVEPKGRTWSLEEAQAKVGGFIEMVCVPGRDTIMLVNEDGISLDLPFNVRASKLAGRPIVGDALITPSDLFQ